MKAALFLLLCSLPSLAQSVDPAKFKEAESHAPKGYPTLFVVASAITQPGTLGQSQACFMQLETLGSIYSVGAEAGFASQCKAFQPGTMVFGRVHNLLGQVVDVIDPAEAKAKAHRYLVKNVTLVDPSKQ